MINELLAAAILSTSFSVRTPNDDTKPLDYEFAIKAEETEGNFTWAFKKDWERELGEKYEDLSWNFNQKSGILYGGLDYVDKESKDIKYTTYNLGLVHKSGFKIGLSVKSNFEDDNIFNVKSELKKWFGRFNIFGLYKHEYYNEKEDFQLKVGIGVKL